MQVKAVSNGKWVVTLSAQYLGANQDDLNGTEWDLDGYIVNLKGAHLRKVAALLNVKVTSRMLVADIRSAIRTALINLATLKIIRDASDARIAEVKATETINPAEPIPAWELELDAADIPTTEDAKYNLFYRATSLGYDRGAAMDVAETVRAYGYVTDPCAKHPGMSTTITRQGYAADGCEACEVIELTGGNAFNQADEIERLRRLEQPTPAERAEDALKIYVGADIAVDGVKGMIKSVGNGEVTIETFMGPGMDYAKSYPCQPILSRILGGVIRIMRDGRFDCVCALVTEAGAVNLPQGGFACRGCGSVFVKQDTEASADVLATSQAVIERNQAAQAARVEAERDPIEDDNSPFMRTLRGLLTLDM